MSTLLIIDDNYSVRESLRFLLERRGFDVLVAANGPEGLALAAQHAVDGAMVDINMPGMNGLEVCRRLLERAAPAGRPLAVWLMTGARTSELTRKAQEVGALALLGKPFDYADLFARFEQQFSPPPKPAAALAVPPPPGDAAAPDSPPPFAS